MKNWQESDLRIQYLRAKQGGWIPFFLEGAAKYKLKAWDGLAIGSRETNLRNIKGDFRGGIYHGFGVMQIDVGTAPDWIKSGAWQDAHKSVLKGFEILASKRDAVVKHFASDKSVSNEERRHIFLALYNGGHAIQAFEQEGNPDAHTTGHDYGQDVMDRAVLFEQWLRADGFLDEPDNRQEMVAAPPPPPAEIDPGVPPASQPAIAIEQKNIEAAAPVVANPSENLVSIASTGLTKIGNRLTTGSLSGGALATLGALAERNWLLLVFAGLLVLCGFGAWALIYHWRHKQKAIEADIRSDPARFNVGFAK